MKRKALGILLTIVMISSMFILYSCIEDDHIHDYSTDWVSDKTYHWQACSGCDEKRNEEEHEWDGGNITKKPTETSEGTKTFTCETCGHTKSESIPPIEHTHTYNQKVATDKYLCSSKTCSKKAEYFYSCSCGNAGTETFEHGDFDDHKFTTYVSNGNATCLEDGTKTAVCDVCKVATDEITDIGSATGIHNTSKYEACDPTCTSVGWLAYEKCSNCDYSTYQEIEKLDHTYDQQVATESTMNSKATCSSRATYYYSCSCEAIGTETFEYGGFGNHIYTTYIPDENATCLDDGTKTAVCDVCKDATDKVLDIGSAKGHTYSTDWNADNTNHWHNATCEHKNEISDLSPHDWDEGIITKEPTNSEDGEKTYTCKVCSKTKTDTIGAPDHIHTYASEYSMDDNYHWFTSNCGHTSEVKAKALHNWDEGTIYVESTVYEEGIKLYACQECQHYKMESIPKIPSFTVVFYDENDRIISQRNYEIATEKIYIPSINPTEGLKFSYWVNVYDLKDIADIDFEKSQINDVYQFKPVFVKVHDIAFIDYEGNLIGEVIEISHGAEIDSNDLPDIPYREGYTARWDEEEILTSPITESKVYTPIYEIIQFTVTFLEAKNGNEITARMVEYGSFAIIPECNLYQLRDKLYGFTGWRIVGTDEFAENIEGNKLTKVYSNLTLYAAYEKSIEQPVLAVHLDGTTVTMSLCLPDGSSLYSVNFSIRMTTQKGICSIESVSINNTTSLNADQCIGDTQLHLDKDEWITYNNKTMTLDFIWGCGVGHTFNIDSNLISINFGLNNGAQMSDIVFTLDDSNIVYDQNTSGNDTQKTTLVLWFY